VLKDVLTAKKHKVPKYVRCFLFSVFYFFCLCFFFEVSHDELSVEEGAFDRGKSSYLVVVK